VVPVPYSLVNVPALGYDLVRLPHGEQVAQVLRTALAAGPQELALLAARHPGEAREPRWDEVLGRGGEESMHAALDLAGQAVGHAQAGDAASSRVLLRRLEMAALGDLAALERILRHDILDWTWLHSGDLSVQDPDFSRACDVLLDAAASAYRSRHLSDHRRRVMAAPFLASRVVASPTTGHPAVDGLLEQVSRCTEADRDRWRRAVEANRPGTRTWAPAMHQATWAVHLADRLRLAADGQLAAVAAFRDGGFDARDAAYGVWNAVSGAVQASVGADLVSEQDHRVLTTVWASVEEDGPAS
jgi:hypothetical protein